MTRFRFDHGNKSLYYDYTRVLLEPLRNQLTYIFKELEYNRPIDELCNNNCIEMWYNNVVEALLHASKTYIPCTSQNVYKEWWDINLNEAKENCIRSHQKWVDAGKPRSGEHYHKRNADKREYRALIHSKKHTDKKGLADSLLFGLSNKNSTKFWSTWNRKVCQRTKIYPKLKGQIL